MQQALLINSWWMIRGENVYTVRFPFEMRLYVKDSFLSFFVECCALVWYVWFTDVPYREKNVIVIYVAFSNSWFKDGFCLIKLCVSIYAMKMLERKLLSL